MNLENQSPLFWIIAILLIIVITREISCWYWKISENLNEKKKQTRILEEILFSINPNATYFEELEENNEKSTP